jgi:hypothetical protein
VPRVSKNSYRALVEQLSILVVVAESGTIARGSEEVHYRTMEELLDQLRTSSCPSLPIVERNDADELVSRADECLAKRRTENPMRYGFSMEHPKYGICGGGPEDVWYVDVETVLSIISNVDEKYRIRLLSRNMVTGKIEQITPESLV